MKQDLDISNIESKPTVVLVSNQSEYDQLMQHLEKEGYMWGALRKKPTNFQPLGYMVEFPYYIHMEGNGISWCDSDYIDFHEINAIPFPEYAAKHIKPKRDRIRIERKKYDELVAERDRYRSLNNEHFIQLQQAEAARNRLQAENSELMQAYKMQNQRHNGDAERFDEIINTKAAEHAHLDTLARKLRDQRDMARFIAALLLIVSVGFAVAVWIGKLVPVV